PRRLPKILRLMRFPPEAGGANPPPLLVVIHSPGFTPGIARRGGGAPPPKPNRENVSPPPRGSRAGGPRGGGAYIDHILALLPFEPAVHQRLGGPPCTYVGHPLVEQVRNLRPNFEEARRRLAMPPTLLVLPGSRTGEIARLLGVFSDAVALVR